MGELTSNLKQQSAAVLVMVGIAVLSVLGMVLLEEFKSVATSMLDGNITAEIALNTTIRATITAFIAGFALVGTFATVTMLIIVVKAIIGVVKGMQ